MKCKCYVCIACLCILCLVSGCSTKETGEQDGIEHATTGSKLKEDSNGKETSQKTHHEKITVYLSGPEVMLNQLEETFEEEHGDVLEFVILGCGPLRQKVWTEKEAGSIQADILWGSDPLLYHALREENLLLAYQPKAYEHLKEEHQSGDEHFTIVSERYIVIAYNKDRLEQDRVPESYQDLEKDIYQGSIVMANANYSSTALAITSGLYQMSGNNWDYIHALENNQLFFAKSNGQVPSKIQEGEFDTGIAPHDAILRLQKKAKKEKYSTPIAIAWPSEGALTIQRPITIIKNKKRSDNEEALAKAFVDYMLSKEAQNITVKHGFISVRKDIELPEGVPSDVKVKGIDWRFAYENEGTIREGVKKIMGN